MKRSLRGATVVALRRTRRRRGTWSPSALASEGALFHGVTTSASAGTEELLDGDADLGASSTEQQSRRCLVGKPGADEGVRGLGQRDVADFAAPGFVTGRSGRTRRTPSLPDGRWRSWTRR